MKTLTAAIATLALTLGGAAVAQTKAQITNDEAKAIALKAVPGTIVKEALETEKTGLVYSFDIKLDGALAGKMKEVEIDAATGKVLEIEDEDD